MLSVSAWSQFIVKNTSGNVVMQVDGDANVTIGSTIHPGALTTHTITILDGAANGRVLKSDASGLASWGTDAVNDADHNIGNEYQNLNLSGNTLSITDGNSVTLPAGSDNQQLSIDDHTITLERGGSVVVPDNVNDADHNIGNEYQDLGSSKSGENVTVTITNGSNTSFSIQDDDHTVGNEYQDLGSSRSGNSATVTITNGSNTSFNIADQFTYLSQIRFLESGTAVDNNGLPVNLTSGGHIPSDARFVQVYWGGFSSYSQDEFSRTYLLKTNDACSGNSEALQRTHDCMVAGYWAGAHEYKSTLIPMPADNSVTIYAEQPTSGTSCTSPDCIRATNATLGVIGYIR